MSNQSELAAHGGPAHSPASRGFDRVVGRTGLALAEWSRTRTDRRAQRRAARRVRSAERLGILDPEAPEAVRRALTAMFRQ